MKATCWIVGCLVGVAGCLLALFFFYLLWHVHAHAWVNGLWDSGASDVRMDLGIVELGEPWLWAVGFGASAGVLVVAGVLVQKARSLGD